MRYQALEKYEIKKPDLEFKFRDNAQLRDFRSEPSKYSLTDGMWRQKTPKNSKRAVIMFSGDIACFDKQFEAAATETGYDFETEFSIVKKIFDQADLVVGNLETQIVPDAPYRSEKLVIEQNFYCNAPLEFLLAVKTSGFDVLTTANNHDIDTGARGLWETIDNLDNFGLIHTGTFKEPDRRFELINVNGLTIAITAFATDHNGLSVNLTEEGRALLLNNYETERAERINKEARSAGADAVFACIHWGVENTSAVCSEQINTARELANMGYDAVIGSHPHVLQRTELLKCGNKSVPVFYSLGNFVSQNINNKKSRSAIACLDVVKEDDNITVLPAYVPVYTSAGYDGKPFTVLPLRTDSAEKKNIRKLNRIINDMGDSIGPTDRFTDKEYKEDKIKVVKKEKRPVPDISSAESFPIEYTDGKFRYSIFRDKAYLVGMNDGTSRLSCAVPNTILDIPVREVCTGAFENNDFLVKVQFDYLPYIAERMFKNAAFLEGIRMKSACTEIRKEAFENCKRLKAAVMGTGVRSIKEKAFAGCTDLVTVKLPDQIADIADDAFEGCEKAVFYCKKGSYAWQYAYDHGIYAVDMDVIGL